MHEIKKKNKSSGRAHTNTCTKKGYRLLEILIGSPIIFQSKL